MMKRAILAFCILLLSNPGFSQAIEMNGIMVVYYTHQRDMLLGSYYSGYCLDSIRYISKGVSLPVGGYLYGREKFMYPPVDAVDFISIFLDKLDLFVENYGNKHTHKGGEIYEHEGKPEHLYIAFNVSGKGYIVTPGEGSVKVDSLEVSMNRNQEEYSGQYGIAPCSYTINEGRYLLPLKGTLEASPLKRKQVKSLRLKRSQKKEFINYGIL